MRCWPCVRGADPSCAGWVPLRVHAPLSRLPGRVRGRGIVPASVRAACNGQGGYEAVAWFPRRYGPHAMVRAGTRPWRDRAACADCLELRCVIRAACEDCSGLQCEYEAVTAMRVPRGACASSRFSPHAGRLTRALARSPADQPPDAHVNPLGRAWAGSPTLDPEGSRSTQKAHARPRRPSLRLAGSHSTQRSRVATIPATASSADAQDDVSAPSPPLRG